MASQINFITKKLKVIQRLFSLPSQEFLRYQWVQAGYLSKKTSSVRQLLYSSSIYSFKRPRSSKNRHFREDCFQRQSPNSPSNHVVNNAKRRTCNVMGQRYTSISVLWLCKEQIQYGG